MNVYKQSDMRMNEDSRIYVCLPACEASCPAAAAAVLLYTIQLRVMRAARRPCSRADSTRRRPAATPLWNSAVIYRLHTIVKI